MFMRKSSLMQKSGEFFAFACSAKIFVIGFVFFFFFSLFVDVFGRAATRFLANVLSFVTHEAYDQGQTHFIGHSKKCSRRSPLGCSSQHLYFMTWLYS